MDNNDLRDAIAQLIHDTRQQAFAHSEVQQRYKGQKMYARAEYFRGRLEQGHIVVASLERILREYAG